MTDSVWHNQSGPGATESWHFDALSDDGREAVIISFHDNYRFSSRFYREGKNRNGNTDDQSKRFPAVIFTYALDGKVVFRSVNEFTANEFTRHPAGAGCSIGNSSFHVDDTAYGSGVVVKIALLTPRRCRLVAELEWLFVESTLKPNVDGESAAALWNIVAPRSDVSGRITLTGRRGKTQKVVHFRGTGYHDHFRTDGSVNTQARRCWGRVHYVDATAVFQHIDASGTEGSSSKIILIRDGSIHEREANGELQNFARDRYGLKVSRRLSFVTDDNIRLRVKPVKTIHSGFFDSMMLSEITLMLRDGKPRKTVGITEFSDPGRMKNPLLRWFSDLRIGRKGRSPLF